MFEQVETIIGRYEAMEAACRPHDPAATEVARRVGEAVSSHMPGLFVEHVGSTAVPGCKGKGIVDLMIAVGDGQLPTAVELLDKLGFQPQTGPDPFPEDRPMRVGTLDHGGRDFSIHLHLIPLSSPEVIRTRKFRDWLGADEDLTAAYVAFKKKIISKGITDSNEYCKAKGEFIEQVLECLA